MWEEVDGGGRKRAGGSGWGWKELECGWGEGGKNKWREFQHRF